MRVYIGNRMSSRLMACLLFVLVSFFCVSCGKGAEGPDGKAADASPVPTGAQQGTPIPTIEADVQEIMLQNIYFRRMEIGPKEETKFSLKRQDGSILSADMVSYTVDGEFALYSLDLYDESGEKVYRFYTEENGDTTVHYEEQGGETVLAGARTDMLCPWLDPARESYFPDNTPQHRVLEILKKRGTAAELNGVTLTEYTLANGNQDVIAGIAGLNILLSSATGPSGMLLSETGFAAYEEGAAKTQKLPTGETFDYFSTWRGKRYNMYISGEDFVMKATDGTEICTTNSKSARWGSEEPFLTNELDGAYFYGWALHDLLAEPDPYADEVGNVRESFQTETYDEYMAESGFFACVKESPLSEAVYQYADGALSLYWPQEDGSDWLLGDYFLLAGAHNGEVLETIPGGDIRFSRNDAYYYIYRTDSSVVSVMNNLTITVNNDGTDRSRLALSLGGFPYGYVELNRKQNLTNGFPKRMSCRMTRDPKTNQIVCEVYYSDSLEIARINYRYVEAGEGDTYCRVAYGYINGRPYGKSVQFCHKETPEVIIYTDEYFNPVTRLGEPFSLPENE